LLDMPPVVTGICDLVVPPETTKIRIQRIEINSFSSRLTINNGNKLPKVTFEVKVLVFSE